jgi:hypothetical protein
MNGVDRERAGPVRTATEIRSWPRRGPPRANPRGRSERQRRSTGRSAREPPTSSRWRHIQRPGRDEANVLIGLFTLPQSDARRNNFPGCRSVSIVRGQSARVERLSMHQAMDEGSVARLATYQAPEPSSPRRAWRVGWRATQFTDRSWPHVARLPASQTSRSTRVTTCGVVSWSSDVAARPSTIHRLCPKRQPCRHRFPQQSPQPGARRSSGGRLRPSSPPPPSSVRDRRASLQVGSG